MPVNLSAPDPAALFAFPGIRIGVAEAGVRKANRQDLTVVLIDTGNANSGTREDGLTRTRATCIALARQLDLAPEQILPFSTGVIMEPLPIDRIEAGLPAALADAADNHWARAAEGIMTTDTVPKSFNRQVQVGGATVSVTGISKGAGMIRPNMATMLGFMATDAKIDHLGLRVLEDDRKYFPRYDAVVLYKLDLPKRLPRAWAALKTLEGRVDEHAMIAMNARAELQSVPFDVIARDFLASTGKEAKAGQQQPKEERRGFAAKLFGPDLWKLARQHLFLVALSVGVAILIGVPIAILVFPHVRLRAVVLGFASLLQTVPSLALLAVLISMLGAIGALPALIALTLYSLLPIMRNTVTGLAEVPNGLRLAGTALGMTPPQSLRLVLLPLALPTLLAGVRTATAIAIGTATIAAFIGAGGFGERIVTGLALNDRELLMAGALPAAALALLSEGIFELVEYLMRRRRQAPASSSQV